MQDKEIMKDALGKGKSVRKSIYYVAFLNYTPDANYHGNLKRQNFL